MDEGIIDVKEGFPEIDEKAVHKMERVMQEKKEDINQKWVFSIPKKMFETFWNVNFFSMFVWKIKICSLYKTWFLFQ